MKEYEKPKEKDKEEKRALTEVIGLSLQGWGEIRTLEWHGMALTSEDGKCAFQKVDKLIIILNRS